MTNITETIDTKTEDAPKKELVERTVIRWQKSATYASVMVPEDATDEEIKEAAEYVEWEEGESYGLETEIE